MQDHLYCKIICRMKQRNYPATAGQKLAESTAKHPYRAAFTNGPTGPGPRGPLIFVNLGGPEQDLKKPMKWY